MWRNKDENTEAVAVQALLAENVRKMRLVHLWTQEELGDKLGLPRESVSLIEHGRRRVNSYELLKLSQAFQVGMEEMFR